MNSYGRFVILIVLHGFQLLSNDKSLSDKDMVKLAAKTCNFFAHFTPDCLATNQVVPSCVNTDF